MLAAAQTAPQPGAMSDTELKFGVGRNPQRKTAILRRDKDSIVAITLRLGLQAGLSPG